jgi:hypothetical protein
MPLKGVETTGLQHDGPIGEQWEDARFVLVCDRAYFSIDKVDRYQKEHQDFVIRLKENVQINRKKSIKGGLNKASNILDDFTCILSTALIAYVLFKFLTTQGSKLIHVKPLSFAGFTRLLLWDDLPLECGFT